jgi:hypothetical protein
LKEAIRRLIISDSLYRRRICWLNQRNRIVVEKIKLNKYRR